MTGFVKNALHLGEVVTMNQGIRSRAVKFNQDLIFLEVGVESALELRRGNLAF